MRELTFKGFLNKSIKSLSYCGSNSIRKLAEEAQGINPRLAEPLFIYALLTGKQNLLIDSVTDESMLQEYNELLGKHNQSGIIEALKAESLPEGYNKVYRSYVSLRDKAEADNDVKELIRKKIIRLQNAGRISNYRIYTDLKLNPGNTNSWLKNGRSDKISLNTARKILDYLSN